MTKPASTSVVDSAHWQLLIVGAGLAGALIAQRLAQSHEAPRILIVDAADQPFGNHTWSFHIPDLDPGDLQWISALVAHRWQAQSVKFRDFERNLSAGYASLTSDSVSRALADHDTIAIMRNSPVVELDPGGVRLGDGRRLTADCVIDARGFLPDPALVLGYQKFFGLEIETTRPHGLNDPIIMDASVAQKDGYRFIYVLPLSATSLLIEDTRYSDGEALNVQELAADISDYAQARGWSIANVTRSEEGVLPISLAFDAPAFWRNRPADVPQVGMRAGLFHPTTGYSLPDAVRVANLVGGAWPIGSKELAKRVRDHALSRARHQRFYRLLNRMLFRAAKPDQRHLVLQRFYTLPQSLIERFYAGRTTTGDIIRILTGKPPVPILRALACLRETELLKRNRP
ncbi:MAG: lycopene beta-cyclase CrtY [Aestuariivirga sp.]